MIDKQPIAADLCTGQGGPAGVDIWLIPLDRVDEASRERFRGLLAPEESLRHDRFLVAGARDEYLVGRALVRTTLSHYGATEPQDWRFVANAYGRPAIAGDNAEKLVFNLSHTRGLVALAVASGAGAGGADGGEPPAIGVDVETVSRASACRDLAGRYFAPSEAAFVRQADGSKLDERFFAFWTLKEAYIKARGMGLALPLDGFAFDVRSDDPAADPTIAFTETCPDDPARWRFLRRSVSVEHRLALAVSPADVGPIRFFETVPLGGSVEPRDLAPEPLGSSGRPMGSTPGHGARRHSP